MLTEAARLFAQRGFTTTTTRDIAAAVGIRQPSLYKHFGSKEAILAALFDRTSIRMAAVVDQLAPLPHGPAVRLYRWLHELGDLMLTTPFVVTALLRTRELADPVFAPQQREVLAGRRYCADLIAGAVADGVFRAVDPAHTSRLVFGVLDAAAVVRSSPSMGIDEVLEFTFRALLADTEALTAIRAEALSITLTH
ncbi:TetR/AcrR family transcriptional regulator [Frankia canadensis]|uniref:TetR/AcrR family transcriptional regulator n=1 Tax=Frankia canadensis TaxID=1836972 RepID=UPI001401EFE6|nr:TetR/AcrR family transcriptional regulator [Frankia canadensis]